MKKRLLVIDDERSLLFAMRDYFEQCGFEVECAAELQEAQALLANFRFDVVITDLHLTDLHSNDAFTVVEFLRERNVHSPVVILTAYATAEVESEMLRLGADRLLRKPIPLQQLAATVKSIGEGRPR